MTLGLLTENNVPSQSLLCIESSTSISGLFNGRVVYSVYFTATVEVSLVCHVSDLHIDRITMMISFINNFLVFKPILQAINCKSYLYSICIKQLNCGSVVKNSWLVQMQLHCSLSNVVLVFGEQIGDLINANDLNSNSKSRRWLTCMNIFQKTKLHFQLFS